MEEIYEAKLAAARAAINDETVWTAFEKNLKDDGGITDAALRECSYEDLVKYGFQLGHFFSEMDRAAVFRPLLLSK